MSSLFDTTVNAEIVRRIESLTADTKPEWGKMTVAQMLGHCRKPVLVALEELQLKRGLVGRLLGGLVKKSVMNTAPFKRNGPTDPRFKVTGTPDFDGERAGLVELVKRFGAGGPDVVTKKQHPFFGPMTVEEWDLLMWKHLDHHLRQFGV